MEGWGEVAFLVRKGDSLLTEGFSPEPLPEQDAKRRILSLNGIWRVEGKALSSPLQIRVPCCFWGTHQLRFERQFLVPDQLPQDASFSLHFLGVNRSCEVILDGRPLGKHEGGHTSFSMDMPRLSPNTKHTLLLAVDSGHHHKNTLPHSGTVGLWRCYGGPFRDVYMEILPASHICDIRVQTKLSAHCSSCVLILEGNVGGSAESPLDVSIQILEEEACHKSEPIASSETTVGTGGHFRDSLVLSRPKPWTPESPFRYLLCLHLLRGEERLDEVTMKVGVRSFHIKNDSILLNGEPILLRGTCRWEFHPVEGSVLSAESMEKEVRQIKQSGSNVVHLLHFPHHPYFLELCDRYGLIVLEEIPVWKIPENHLRRDKILHQAQRLLVELVQRDRNRPSVLAWGLGTSIDLENTRACTYLYEVQTAIRGLDDRPTFIFNETFPSDPPTGLVDLVGGKPTTTSRERYTSHLHVLEKGTLSDLKTGPAAAFDCNPAGWPREYPGLSSPPSVNAEVSSNMTMLIIRLLTAFAFGILFVAPMLHWYRFEEKEGRALGTVLSLAAFALGLICLKDIVKLQPPMLHTLDEILHALFPSARWQDAVRLFFWENDLCWSSLMALFLLGWAMTAFVPFLLAKSRKTPGDRVGLPPAALGLLLHPVLISLTGASSLRWDRMVWHQAALFLSVLLTVTLYVRNASVRWKLGKRRLVVFLVAFVFLLSAAAALILRTMTSLWD